MNVYYVEVLKWLRTNLEKPWESDRYHIAGIGNIYRSKEMAKRELMIKLKEAQKELRERRAEVGNCHEHVVTERYIAKEGWATVCIKNGFNRTTPEQIIVALRTKELIGGKSSKTG